MKKVLVTGVSAIALSFGAFGTAQATHSLQSNLGDQFDVNVLADAAGGNWNNIAVNTAEIDASVNATGEAAVLIDVSTTGADSVFINIPTQTLAIGESDAASAEVDIFFGGIIDLGDISTLAAGVVADQHIASSVATEHDTFEFSVSDEQSAASSAASSTQDGKTAAESAFESASSTEFSVSTSSFYEGPKQPVSAVNVAYNNADINASVNLEASSITTGDISTLAAGVVATQTISMGFDGSNLNSALNE